MVDIQETTKNADCSFTTKLEDKNVVDIGSDVTLSCCLDKEYGVRWYNDQSEISMNDKYKFKDERGKHKLIIADIQEEDSGVYSCESGTTKTSCILNVEDCACSFTTNLVDRNVADIGSEVTLSCCLDMKFDVRWYKDQREIVMSNKFKIKDERGEHKLIIADIQEEDSGVYSCRSGTTKTSCKLIVEECSFTTKLEDITVIDIGSDVMLSCCLDKEYGVRWYKYEEKIILNDKFKVEDGRWVHKFIIADIQEEDSGVYYCKCGTTKTKCVLKVEANRFIKQLEDVTITAGENLILACELNAVCKNIKWYKSGDAISDRVTTTDVKIAGSNTHRYKLELNRVKMEDAGEYRCHNETIRTTCNVTVKEIKELKIDDSVLPTELLYELNSTKERLKMTEDELSNTKTKLDRVETDVNEKETKIAELRALLKEKGDMSKNKESERENKNYIKELEDKNQQLVKKLESISKELESTKQQSAQMQEQIKKLEGEKKDLEKKVGILESYINAGTINEKQQKATEKQQKILEYIKTMMEASEQRKSKKSRTCSVS